MGILEKVNYFEDVKRLSIFEFYEFVEEIREFLLYNIVNIGGYLAVNLGVVELIFVLLKVFDLLKDKIVWDVGY